jgi:hypothetical protein
MFGMLDYRAHKLYWLFTLPFRLASTVFYFIFIAIAVSLGIWTGYQPPLLQMIVAYVVFEAMLLVFNVLWLFLIMLPLEKIFFWLVDVIPARGEDTEEAKEIVRKGRAIWLTKKMTNHIDEWTFEDTNDYVSLMSWRARLFFNEREKFVKRIAIMQEVYYDTGKQPIDLGKKEITKLVKPYMPGWFQTAIVHPNFFNSIMAATIIIVAILYLS